MSAVISNTDPGNLTFDGVFTDIAPATPAIPLGAATGLYANVGGANDGVPNVFTPYTDASSGMSIFGNDTTSANSLLRGALSAMPECSLFGSVRVTDGTDVSATITIPGAGVFATGTLTIAGTPTLNDTITATLVNGSLSITTPAYTVKNGDTVTTVAAALAGLINASAAVLGGSAFLSACSNTAGVINIAALAAGTAGNSITINGTVTGGHTTVTPSAATALTGGAASSGTVLTLTRKCTGSRANLATAAFYLQSGTPQLNPVYGLIINYPNAQPESWNGILASAVGGAYSSVIFLANIASAVNGTTKGVTGSTRWTATAGGSTQAPSLASVSGTGGTDGTAGITTAILVGSNGLSTKTGMYALTGQISGAQFSLAGCTDPAVAQTLQSFAVTENAIAHYAYPQNTSTGAAQQLRSQYNIQGNSLITDMDWDYVNDTISGLLTYVPPQDKIAGVIASLPAYVYPGNQPVNGVSGILSTDHIVNGQNQVVGAEPGQRQQSGLLYLSFMPRNQRGTQLGLPHGVMSDGVTPISDVRMLKQIVSDLQGILGTIVGMGMNTDPTSPHFLDPAGSAAKDAADSYFQGLLAPHTGYPFGVITKYQFLLGADNTQMSAVQGLLIPRVLVTTLSPAQYILQIVQVGRTVQILAATSSQAIAA